ncbi:hypothetical protein GCM10009850_034920 [Nonomuraea monospora]|uniref:Uncharacterized protein n=1 Tax=Nonomuraea monospora TaxID=568818 RepID=A0ABP5P8G3_9ACTN
MTGAWRCDGRVAPGRARGGVTGAWHRDGRVVEGRVSGVAATSEWLVTGLAGVTA